MRPFRCPTMSRAMTTTSAQLLTKEATRKHTLMRTAASYLPTPMELAARPRMSAEATQATHRIFLQRTRPPLTRRSVDPRLMARSKPPSIPVTCSVTSTLGRPAKISKSSTISSWWSNCKARWMWRRGGLRRIRPPKTEEHWKGQISRSTTQGAMVKF